jgi:hypothetical protein
VVVARRDPKNLVIQAQPRYAIGIGGSVTVLPDSC